MPSIYDEWALSKLMKECRIREIPVQKRTKKDVLVALLMADDEEKEVKTPPTPPAKEPIDPIFLRPFVLPSSLNDVADEEGEPENPYEGKTTLAIGIGLSTPIGISKQSTLFTGIKEDESVRWGDLIDGKVPSGIFKNIIIYETTVFFPLNSKKVETKRAVAVLKTLANEGEVKVINFVEAQDLEFNAWLIQNNYNTSSTQTIQVLDVPYTFNVFRKGGSGSRNALVVDRPTAVPSSTISFTPTSSSLNRTLNPRRTETSHAPAPDIIEEVEEVEDPTPVKVRPPGKYKLLDSGITATRRGTTFETPIQEPQTGITLTEFRQEVERDEFIQSFCLSIKNLLKYKTVFYKKKLVETRKEFERVKKKVQTLMSKGVSGTTIKEMYPMYDFYAGFIVELEELLALVLSRLKEVDEKTVQCNLREVIDDPVQGFACIVGRDDVKNRIAGQLYAFSRSYKIFTNTFNNICLLGSPGVGKTGLAKVIGYVFSKTGILATENIKITSRSSLVGQYVGQTAPRTKSAFLETLEGILFIDEAYQLTPPDPGRDFGPEAVTELVNLIDKFIGMNVVIVAGYEKEMMTQFFPCNEGLARRFPYRLILTPYSVAELTDILIRFVEQKIPHEIDRRLANYLYSIIVSLNDDGVFENQAGDMLNLGSSLVKSINGCYRVRWEERDLEHNKPIILEGLEDFLYPKGLTLADTCLREYQ